MFMWTHIIRHVSEFSDADSMCSNSW